MQAAQRAFDASLDAEAWVRVESPDEARVRIGSKKSTESVLLGELQAGQDVLLVTDAGTPGISDPGSLVNCAICSCFWPRSARGSIRVPGAMRPDAARSCSSTVWKRKRPRTFGWQNTICTACR